MLSRYIFTKDIFYKLQWLTYRLYYINYAHWVRSSNVWNIATEMTLWDTSKQMFLKCAIFSGNTYKQGHAIHRSRMNENIVL